MKHIFLFSFLMCFLFANLTASAQDEFREGLVSYITTQNIYVKFQSTEGMSIGDTLFCKQNSQLVASLVVKNLSSISCFCYSIVDAQFSVGDSILARIKKVKEREPEVSIKMDIPDKPTLIDTISNKKATPKNLRQNINGRIALSSYSNFSSNADFSQRMRYTLLLNAQNINDSKLSVNTYISFAHKNKEWGQIKDNIFNGLKIYNLSLNYAFNENNVLWVGRNINPRLSSVGAIDGIQYETKIKSFVGGVFAGSRPDFLDYNFNFNLLHYGGYLGHDYNTQKGNMQSSVAFIEQKNSGNTDRRFAYLQHSNALISNFYFFGSVELDFYNQILNKTDSTYSKENSPKLTSLFLSLRYRMLKNLSLSISYSARQNIIYYETYKDILDRLLETSTQQGYRINVNYSPFNNISIGLNSGYRYSKSDPNDSKNMMAYFTYNNVPWIKSVLTASATLLQTAYVSGNIYSLGLSRDIVSGKLYGGLNYRYVDYKFRHDVSALTQNMAELNLTWRILKKLSCSINYEGTFEKGRNTDRIYINLTQRF